VTRPTNRLSGAGQRRSVLAFAAIAVLLLVGVGAVVRNSGRAGDGMLNTATRGGGLDVNSPPSDARGTPPPPPVPSPEVTANAVAAVNAAVAAANQMPATTPPTMADPPMAVPNLPSLPGPITSAPSGPAMVTLVNEFPGAVSVNLNGTRYSLAGGQSAGPVAVTPSASGNDVVELNTATDPTCGLGDSGGYFRAGRDYVFTVLAGPGNCQDGPGPSFTVTPA